MVNGERRHTRRVAVAKEGQYELARLVYDFTAHKQPAEESAEEPTE